MQHLWTSNNYKTNVYSLDILSIFNKVVTVTFFLYSQGISVIFNVALALLKVGLASPHKKTHKHMCAHTEPNTDNQSSEEKQKHTARANRKSILGKILHTRHICAASLSP